MTPKEKAEELVKKFTEIECVVFGCGKDEGNNRVMYRERSKESSIKRALDCVAEIMRANTSHNPKELHSEFNQYWFEVKKEIDKL